MDDLAALSEAAAEGAALLTERAKWLDDPTPFSPRFYEAAGAYQRWETVHLLPLLSAIALFGSRGASTREGEDPSPLGWRP